MLVSATHHSHPTNWREHGKAERGYSQASRARSGSYSLVYRNQFNIIFADIINQQRDEQIGTLLRLVQDQHTLLVSQAETLASLRVDLVHMKNQPSCRCSCVPKVDTPSLVTSNTTKHPPLAIMTSLPADSTSKENRAQHCTLTEGTNLLVESLAVPTETTKTDSSPLTSPRASPSHHMNASLLLSCRQPSQIDTPQTHKRPFAPSTTSTPQLRSHSQVQPPHRLASLSTPRRSGSRPFYRGNPIPVGRQSVRQENIGSVPSSNLARSAISSSEVLQVEEDPENPWKRQRVSISLFLRIFLVFV